MWGKCYIINKKIIKIFVTILLIVTIVPSHGETWEAGNLNMDEYISSPPNNPTCLHPPNHDTDVDVNDSLLWTCIDPDGDELTYDVYFGTSSNPPLVSKDRTLNYYNPPGAMSYNTKYYWKIVAEDEHGESTIGPIWDFTTILEPNYPPYIPNNPYPENDSIDIATDVILTWSGGDPNSDDTVTYDVYFGQILFLKIASNISNTSINPGTLENGLNHYWRIVAWDNHSASTVGPLWHFTTINPDNNPPNKPSKPIGQTNGNIDQNYTYTTSSTDPEGNLLYYNWSWGDSTYSGWIGPFISGFNVNQSHSWNEKGNYTIKVKAKDIHGAESEWSDPIIVSMPKTKPKAFNTPLTRLLENYPLIYQLLQRFLGL